MLNIIGKSHAKMRGEYKSSNDRNGKGAGHLPTHKELCNSNSSYCIGMRKTHADRRPEINVGTGKDTGWEGG